MAPVFGQKTYGVWTQASEGAADFETRMLAKQDTLGLLVSSADNGGVNSASAQLVADSATAVAQGVGLTLKPGTYHLTTSVTFACGVVIPAGVIFLRDAGVTLTFNGWVFASRSNHFTGTGNVTFGPGAIAIAYAEWYGFGATATDTANGGAIDAAILSNAPEVLLPSGSYSYSGNGISIDRAIRFGGTGSCGGDGNATGNPGAATTKLTYTGTGVGLTLVGSGTEGKENLHVHDLSLWGTASAAGGVQLGSSVLVTKGSCKNLHIRGFTKVGAWGYRYAKVLSWVSQNVYCQANYDGFANLSGDVATTIYEANCMSRSNVRFGRYIAGFFETGQFDRPLAEGNGDAAWCFEGNGIHDVDIDNNHSEANNGTSGTAPLQIGLNANSGGTGVSSTIRFWGGGFYDAVAGRTVDSDYASAVAFHDVSWTSTVAGAWRATAHTKDCSYNHQSATIYEGMVAGNTPDGVAVLAQGSHGFERFTLAGAGATKSVGFAGTVLLTDLTNDRVALVRFAVNRHVAQILNDVDAFCHVGSGNAGTVNLDYSSGFFIQNSTAGSIDFMAEVISNRHL
ncbi:MAG: hypothetical protein JWM41_2910 [Gemmatimonadetes bacterium]|nr:hypothetical protein [Gemmatimonadota bacterium]